MFVSFFFFFQNVLGQSLTKSWELDICWNAVVRREVSTSGVSHVCQIEFVHASLIGVSDVAVFEHMANVLSEGKKNFFKFVDAASNFSEKNCSSTGSD